MRNWLRTLRSVAALPPSERRGLARAQAALLAAQLRVWTRPAGRLIHPGAAPSSLPPTASAREDAAGHAAARARAVDRAAAAGLFRPRCLVRALALQALLARDGGTGARSGRGGRRGAPRLLAHAWVEVHGAALGDDGRLARGFLPLHPAALPVHARVPADAGVPA
jgi:hypothetical protein